MQLCERSRTDAAGSRLHHFRLSSGGESRRVVADVIRHASLFVFKNVPFLQAREESLGVFRN